MPYVPTTKERVEDAMPYILPVICAILILGLGGWLAWHQFGPKKTARKKPTIAATPEAKARMERKASLSADVAALEKTYQTSVSANVPIAVLESLLTRAIDRQREVLKLEDTTGGPAAEKLARLEGLRGDLRARTASAESRALEKAADEETARGAQAAALAKLRDALRLQREANKSAKDQELVDVAREVRLAKAVEDATVGPLRDAVAASRAKAEAAVKAQNWSAALKAYEQARAQQADLTAKSDENRGAHLALLEQIDTELASLKAADLAAKLATTEKSAAAARAAGRLTEAAALLLTAIRQQEELNTQYPKSRFVSTDKLSELAVERETVLSSEILARAAALERESGALLQRRQTAEAKAKITEATGLVARVAAEFPRSRSLDPALRRKLEYLALRSDELESLQNEVYAATAPVPGEPGALMLRTEVSQELYARVMNINPSRNQGRGLPVDSVSWQDARDFCERLSWLLGAKVRLPREAEFAAAWKGAVSGQEWSADNASGRSRETGRTPPSAAGFHDLAGNVAEWLELPRDDGGTMPVAGGSFLDPAATLAKMPVVLLEKRTRARHVGFRVVIENSLGGN